MIMKKILRAVLYLTFVFLFSSCGGPSKIDADFSLSNLYSVNSLYILYDKNFSGDISYIVSRTSLGITTEKDFNASTAAKTDVTITADDLLYNDYVRISSLSSGTEYNVYILDKTTSSVEMLVETTQKNTGSVQQTGTITNGYGTGTITYNINYPSGYDRDASVLWPLLLSVKGPNMTSSDNNFPCITLNIDISWSNYTQYMNETENLRQLVKSIIENPAYRIDKNRLYAFGFSAGGGVVLMIANSDGSDQYQFKAVVAVGINDWIGYTGLGGINTWLFYGENDSYGAPTASFHQKIISAGGSGEHRLTAMPGIGHDSSPVWSSPYTWSWMLGK